jgi:hypothetical protein
MIEFYWNFEKILGKMLKIRIESWREASHGDVSGVGHDTAVVVSS